MRPIRLLLIASALCCPAAFGVDRDVHHLLCAVSDRVRTRPADAAALALHDLWNMVLRPVTITRIHAGDPGTAPDGHWIPLLRIQVHHQGRDESIFISVRDFESLPRPVMDVRFVAHAGQP